jgi:poly(hydroxyalkanoate) granule-associated protein
MMMRNILSRSDYFMAQFAVGSVRTMHMTSKSKTDDPFPAGWTLWQPPLGLPEPARQVWLAGLGALARAQAEGGKAFETLVHQGLALQTQTSQMAREHLVEAAQAATQPLEHISGNLSKLFEDRVARALASLGLPSAQDWAVLLARMQALETTLQDNRHATPRTASRPSTVKFQAKATMQSPAPFPVTAKPTVKKLSVGAGIKPRGTSSKKPRITPSL